MPAVRYCHSPDSNFVYAFIPTPFVAPQEAAARAEEAARLHREFMSMLRRVLDGHMDSSNFEDSCRALLGTNSYVLFTLDKLIQKFIKHMAVRCACEPTHMLTKLAKGASRCRTGCIHGHPRFA